MSFEAKIAVLYDFDGFRANVVEIITRKIQTTGRGSKEKRFISYKGKRQDVFTLPNCYLDTTPFCISVRNYS